MILLEDYLAPVVATKVKDTHQTCEQRKPNNRSDGFYIFEGNTLKWQVKDNHDKIDIRVYDNDKNFMYNLRVKDTGRFFLKGLGGTFFKIRNVDQQCGLGDWTSRISR